MKRSYLVVFAAFISGMLFSGSLQAQTIEVEVEEDVSVQALSFTYRISLEDDLSSVLLGLNFEDEGEGEDLELEGMTSEEIQEMLKKEGFSFRLDGGSGYELSKHSSPKAILVDLKNKAELDRLYGLLEDMSYLDGEISDVEFESLDKYYEEVFSKLTKKAKKKASLLAQSAGKELGAVVSILEAKENNPFGDLMSQYNKMMKSMPWMNMWFSEDTMSKTITVEMVYVFELK